MQIKQALLWAAEFLKNSKASESASLDSSLILSYVTGLSKVGLITHDTDDLSDSNLAEFRTLIEKRATGYPVAYILGYKDFWSLKLKVNEHTLIPRSDTETLVDAALNLNVKGPVLDMGTGSGAIILALKAEYKNAIDAYGCDLSEGALEVAKENAVLNHLDVTFFKSDWFKSIPDIRFSMIVSNPPYIEDTDEHLLKSSLPFEPSTALSSGADGLDDIRVIAKNCLSYMCEDAPLLLEHGYNQGKAVRDILESSGLVNVKTITDLEGRDRVTLGFKS